MNDGDVDISMVCKLEGESLGRDVKSIVGEKLGFGWFVLCINRLDVSGKPGMLGECI